MKLGFKLGNIEYKDVKFSNVEVNVQYSAEELVTEFNLVKRIIKEIPEIVADLATGALAFGEVDKVFSKYVTELETENDETKAAGMDLIKSAINKIKTELLPKANAEQKNEETQGKAV